MNTSKALFEGAMVLHAARIGMELRGVVSFHGALRSFHTPSPGEVKAKVLVCHGAEDKLVSEQDVEAFKEEMSDARADCRFAVVQGALHGFASQDASEKARKYGLPLIYNPEAHALSWQEMRNFLNGVLA